MSDYDWHWFQGPRVYACKVNGTTDLAIRYAYALSGTVFPVTQGSMFGGGGGASASAGTHNGTSVVDFSVTGKSNKEIMDFVRWLRKLGWAAWFRPKLPGVWPPHIHGVLIQPKGIAGGAVAQIGSYRRHRNGLRGDAFDYQPYPGVTSWPQAQKRYVNQYRKLTKPPAPKGLFGMSKTTRKECTRVVHLKEGVETALPITDDGDVTLVSGPTSDYNVNLQICIEGLPAGKTLKLTPFSINFLKGKPNQAVWEGNTIEIVSTPGMTYGQVIFDGSLGTPPKGWSRRLRVKALSSEPGVSITRITLNARKV